MLNFWILLQKYRKTYTSLTHNPNKWRISSLHCCWNLSFNYFCLINSRTYTQTQSFLLLLLFTFVSFPLLKTFPYKFSTKYEWYEYVFSEKCTILSLKLGSICRLFVHLFFFLCFKVKMDHKYRQIFNLNMYHSSFLNLVIYY